MSPETWSRVRKLFDEAVLLPPEERPRFLDRSCPDDEGLREEVEKLLLVDREAADLLDSDDRPDVSDLLTAPSDLSPGVRLGRYALTRVIASGGMGTVWEAIQERPKRTVAVKTIRMGFGSDERRQRFQQEAEVLGRLRHPGIAQIFEAGTHEEAGGSFPYFAMELVEGALDVMRFADEKRLSRHERLELFAQVCDAVHHGHQRGVVHRDLKPGNILVDAAGQPKVIDFGLARATRLEESITTAETAPGALMGTLAYMSPEQLEGDPERLDTRSDVYSLGVVLYQLVTGRLPHDIEGLPIRRTISVLRDADPRRPAGVPVDLVWVIFRAMEKERERRYASAAELAADVRRFQEHEPVLAGPPSVAYRLRKLVRRHRVLITTLTLVGLSLAAGVVGVLWKAAEARAERDVAIRVNEFFDEMLLAPTPHASGRDVPMSAVLDAAAARIETEFADRQDVQARIRASIGKAYQQLGRYAEAEPHLRVALDASLAEFGEVHETTAEAIHHYGSVLRRTQRLEEAEPQFRRLVEIRRALVGPHHVDTLSAEISLATVLFDTGELEEVEAITRRLIEDLPGKGATRKEYEVAVSAMNNLVGVHERKNELEEAAEQALRTVEYATEHLGEENAYTAMALATYAARLGDLERTQEAEEVARIAVALFRDLVGEGDLDLIRALHNHGAVLLQMRRYAEAETLLRESHETSERQGIPVHPATTRDWGRVLVGLKRHEEAVELWQANLPLIESETARQDLVKRLAQVLEYLGRSEEAAEVRARYGVDG